MNKKISSITIHALKQALVSVYWYKNDLKNFLLQTIEKKRIFIGMNWDLSKRQIIDLIFNEMVLSEETYQQDLLNILKEISSVNDFSHLENLDNGESKVRVAKLAVEALKKHTSGYLEQLNEIEQIKKRQEIYKDKSKITQLFNQKLTELKNNFTALVIDKNLQQRGYQLETFTNKLFELFDLDPKASYKINTEQIDGAFTFHDQDYLLEVKWQKKPVTINELNIFKGKIENKLDNTLGLFISVNGFNRNNIEIYSKSRSVMILCDGQDIMAVLDARITLPNLLLRKRRHASETGNIFLPFNEFSL